MGLELHPRLDKDAHNNQYSKQHLKRLTLKSDTAAGVIGDGLEGRPLPLMYPDNRLGSFHTAIREMAVSTRRSVW